MNPCPRAGCGHVSGSWPHVRFDERYVETEQGGGHEGTGNRKGRQQTKPPPKPPRHMPTLLSSPNREEATGTGQLVFTPESLGKPLLCHSPIRQSTGLETTNTPPIRPRILRKSHLKVIAKKVPQAIHVLDRFHVMQKMSKAPCVTTLTKCAQRRSSKWRRTVTSRYSKGVAGCC